MSDRTNEPRWALRYGAESATSLAADPGFLLLLRYARASNALRFGLSALIDGEEDGTPARERQRLNAFMLVAGIVTETLGLARATERELRDSAAFREGFGTLLDDPGAMAYAEDVLGGVASSGPFRFDTRPVQLRTGRDVELGEGHGKQPGSFYYALADAPILAGPLAWGEDVSLYEHAKEHMEHAALLAQRCADAADRLIAEQLRTQGWRLA